MLGESLDAATVDEGGIVGDRAYAIVDRETGKVASAKHPKVWPDLLACRARFTQGPSAGAGMPAAEIELKNGTTVRTDAADADDVLSRFFGRDVELGRSAPEDFTIDQYHPDLENLDPEGHRDASGDRRLQRRAAGDLRLAGGGQHADLVLRQVGGHAAVPHHAALAA